MADDATPKRLTADALVRRPGGHVMPYTGPWERENPEIGARIWQCLTKQFHAYEDMIKSACVYSDSPIEEMLLAALLTEDSAFFFDGAPILIPPGKPWHMPVVGEDTATAQFVVAPQLKVAGYRIDIACGYSWNGKRIAIECDGHAFHEKTAEQAQHDKERDRVLYGAGWPVIRFTGSEINADPFSCAAQAAKLLTSDKPYSPDMLILGGRK